MNCHGGWERRANLRLQRCSPGSGHPLSAPSSNSAARARACVRACPSVRVINHRRRRRRYRRAQLRAMASAFRRSRRRRI
ncbi:unnamed protein product [Lampetra fluviatilis]